MVKIHIVEEALNVIKSEATLYKHKGIEAGGSLLGIQTEDQSLILYALRTGTNADQSYGHLETDVDYQNRLFNRINEHYDNNLQYLIDWHLHPMYFPGLSGTDKASCKEILKDHPELVGLPLILVTYRQEEQICVPLWVTLSNDNISVQETELVLLPSNHESITRALGNPYIKLENLNDQCLLKMLQRNRIPDELKKIKELCDTVPSLIKTTNNRTAIIVELNDEKIIAILPKEYPLNPPQIVLDNNKGDEGCIYTSFWNSDIWIAELINEVKEQKENESWLQKIFKTKPQKYICQ